MLMLIIYERERVRECIRHTTERLKELTLTGEVTISGASANRRSKIVRETCAVVVEPGQSGDGYACRFVFKHGVVAFAVATFSARQLVTEWALVSYSLLSWTRLTSSASGQSCSASILFLGRSSTRSDRR